MALKLVYFRGIRGRAESVRMMLRFTGTSYTDVDIDLKDWGPMKKGGTYPWNALPALAIEEGGQETMIGQSGAINRYVATKVGLYPFDDPVALAKTDAIFEASQDLAVINPMVNLPNMRFGDKKDEEIAKFFKGLGFTLNHYEASLGSENFFAGDKPLMGDFGLFHAFDLCLELNPGVFDKHAALKEWTERMGSLPGVDAYLAERPDHISL